MPPRSGRKKKRGYGALTVCGCCAVWLCVYLAFVVYVQSVSSAGPGRPAAPTGEDTSSRALPGDEVGGRSRSLRGRITDPQVLRGLPNDVSTPPPQAPLVHHVPVAPAPAAPATVAVPPLPSAPRAPTAPETAARRPAPAIDESHRTHEAPAAASYSQPATTLQSSAVAGIAAVPVEGVVQYLSGLAKLDSATLRMKLNVSLGDVFGLQVWIMHRSWATGCSLNVTCRRSRRESAPLLHPFYHLDPRRRLPENFGIMVLPIPLSFCTPALTFDGPASCDSDECGPVVRALEQSWRHVLL